MSETKKELRPEIAAVWGAFLFEGIMVSTLHAARSSEVLDRWGDTCTDLVAQACEVLPLIWQKVEPYWESAVFDRPGAFETEVISEIGSLIGDHILGGSQTLPAPSVLTASINALVDEFLRDYEVIDAGEPLSSGLAAIWGSFLYEGLYTSSKETSRADAVRTAWGLGHVDLVCQCCDAYLPEVWRQVRKRWHTADFPGVFEYEVISELGTVLGDFLIANGKLPDADKVPSVVRVLVEDFFSQAKAMKP